MADVKVKVNVKGTYEVRPKKEVPKNEPKNDK
jgi:hypothetical protein